MHEFLKTIKIYYIMLTAICFWNVQIHSFSAISCHRQDFPYTQLTWKAGRFMERLLDLTWVSMMTPMLGNNNFISF